MFRAAVERDPSHLAIDGIDIQLSYGELDRRSNRVARQLLESGTDARTVVPILAGDHDTLLVSIMGAAKAACLHVVLDPRYPRERMLMVLDDVEATVILADPSTARIAEDLTSSNTRVLVVSEGEDADLPFDPPGLPLDGPAYLLYTSGSSGTPKGIVKSHRSIVEMAFRHIVRDGTHLDKRIALLHPPGFAAGAGLRISAIVTGVTLCPFPIREAHGSDLADWIDEKRITEYRSVPSVFRELTSPLDNRRFEHVRLIRLGGEAVTTTDIEMWRRHFPNARIAWGLATTETGAISSLELEPGASFEGEVVHCGYPNENVVVEILDDDGRPVPSGDVGEIVVHSPRVSRGYWNRPELSAERFREDPEHPGWRIYRTGDLGRFLPDGALVHEGRKDAQLKIRGNRVSANEVEDALLRHPAIREVAVVGHPTEYGLMLVAWIVSSEPLDGKNVRSFAASILPDYMVPTRYRFIDELPRNSSRKIDRLRLTAEPDPVASESDVSYLDETEERLAAIWARILGLPTVSATDDFFAIGGDSLRAARVFDEVEKLFGKRVPLASLLQAPTLKSQAAILRRVVNPEFDLVVPIRIEGSNPPLFLAAGAGGNVVIFKDLADALGPDHPVWGLQAPGLGEDEPDSYDVEQTAARYAEGIRAIQPEGPWLVAGYSAGGIFAYETARQLDPSGRNIALLAILDTALLGRDRTITKRILQEARRFRNNPARYVKQFGRRIRGAYVFRRQIRLETQGKQVPRHFRNVARSRSESAKRYVPPPWDGSIVLIRSESWSQMGRSDENLGWGKLVNGRVESHDLPGHHLQLIRGNHAASVARILRDSAQSAIFASQTAAREES